MAWMYALSSSGSVGMGLLRVGSAGEPSREEAVGGEEEEEEEEWEDMRVGRGGGSGRRGDRRGGGRRGGWYECGKRGFHWTVSGSASLSVQWGR
jgi:hypothetical protein